MKYAIKCEKLTISFDNGQCVLNNLDLFIEKGLITVILGLSGAGKSVLLKNFLGLIKPTSGSLEVLGKNLITLSSKELKELRSKYGVLFQNGALFNDMTVIENVIFPLKERLVGESHGQLYNRASDMLLALGIDRDQFQKLPFQISGGMQKRVAIARALILEPEILFYDEPVTGLDPITKSMVNKLIVETHKKNIGLTSVIVSHDLLSSLHIADKIAMMYEGKVLLHASPDDFKNSKLSAVRRFMDIEDENS